MLPELSFTKIATLAWWIYILWYEICGFW